MTIYWPITNFSESQFPIKWGDLIKSVAPTQVGPLEAPGKTCSKIHMPKPHPGPTEPIFTNEAHTGEFWEGSQELWNAPLMKNQDAQDDLWSTFYF